LLYSVVGGGVVMVAAIIGLLVWYMNRVPVPYQMMAYLPDDANVASGVNVGHLQKYPEFYKNITTATNDKTFWKLDEALNKATGAEIDYAVYGAVQSPSGLSEITWVIRTKKEFDREAISKLPGAKQYSAEGVNYYTANDAGGFSGQMKV